MPSDRILMGVIGRPHGVRGLVHLHCEAEDPATLEAHLLHDEQGRAFRIAWRGVGIAAVVRGDGTPVADRDQAAALARTRLHVDRAELPEPATDEFYHADLIGLAAFDAEGRPIGPVVAVHDYGAGVSLELARPSDDGPTLVPFTRDAVPVVDVPGGRLVVRMPDELEWHGDAAGSVSTPEAGASA